MKNLSWYEEDDEYWDEEESFQKISQKTKTVKHSKETIIKQKRKEKKKREGSKDCWV